MNTMRRLTPLFSLTLFLAVLGSPQPAWAGGTCVEPGNGDADGNGLIGLADFATYPACLTGPAGTAVPECCALDLDGSTAVDLRDYAAHQRAVSRCVTDAGCNLNQFCPRRRVCADGACSIALDPCGDDCGEAPPLAGEGVFEFDNTAATRDGPAHTACVFFGDDQIDADVWSCWTAPCTATVFMTTCDRTVVDTKLAVYDGCTCPATDERLLACNDDVCEVQSQVAFEAVEGNGYLIRLGTFPGEPGGTGSVSIACGLATCPAAGDCFAAHLTPGCDDEGCCEALCAADPFCCEEEWDAVCADEADGFCGDGFDACTLDAGDCDDPNGNGTPGCDDIDCCNAVCFQDPFCCGVGGVEGIWDELCAELSAAVCRNACDSRAGNCFETLCVGGSNDGKPCLVDEDCPDGGLCEGNGTPGCELDACCAEVCPRDPFCCQIEWDAFCAETAREFCSQP